MCQAPLGSVEKSFRYGINAVLIMTVVWVLMTVIFSVQLPLVAAFFGGGVAIAIGHFTGARGWRHQCIATFLAITGIVFANVIAMSCYAIVHMDGGLELLSFAFLWKDFWYALTDGGVATVFYVIGAVSSFGLIIRG